MSISTELKKKRDAEARARNTKYSSLGTVVASVDDTTTEGQGLPINVQTVAPFSDFLAEDSSNHSEVVGAVKFGIKAGRVVNDNVVAAVASQQVSITDDATNYLSATINMETQTASINVSTTGFPTGSIPLFKVIAAAGAITTVEDNRSWLALQNSNAQSIKSIAVDVTGIQDGYVLTYDSASGTFMGKPKPTEGGSDFLTVGTTGDGIGALLSIDYTVTTVQKV